MNKEGGGAARGGITNFLFDIILEQVFPAWWILQKFKNEKE